LGFQSQGIAYSLDKGRTWVKYDKNPVFATSGVLDFSGDPGVLVWRRGALDMTLALGIMVVFLFAPYLKE